MRDYNNNYIQKNKKEKVTRMMVNNSASIEHSREVRKAINKCANDIILNNGLSQDVYDSVVALIYEDKDAAAELPLRVNFVVNILKKYGYDDEESLNIINSNFSLIKQKPLNLVHNLAIANQYGLDEELLINNRIYSSINEKEMYALIEELKENGVEVTLENVLALNTQFKKSNQMSKVVELHPLLKRTILVYRTLYDRNINSKTLTKTK